MVDPNVSRIESRRAGAEKLANDIEGWQAEHLEAMAVRDVEGLIQDVLANGRDCLRITKSFYADLRAGSLRAPFQVGKALRFLFVVLLRLSARAQSAATAGFMNSYQVDGLAELQELTTRLKQGKDWLTRTWPRVDDEVEAKVLDDYHAGRVLTPGEAVREVLDHADPSDY